MADFQTASFWRIFRQVYPKNYFYSCGVKGDGMTSVFSCLLPWILPTL
jgi:hypothetical protein